jgi:hypothetical protein
VESRNGNKLGRLRLKAAPDEAEVFVFWLREVPIIREQRMAKASRPRMAMGFR